jgi:hypothetical protein
MAIRGWAFKISRRRVVPDRLAPTMKMGADMMEQLPFSPKREEEM